LPDLELTRSKSDRRLYELNGTGRLRLEGLFSRKATADADGSLWRFARTGFWGRRIEATDAAGSLVGEFEQHSFRRGGAIRWAGRELVIRPASSWRERYALAEGEDELALLSGKSWGRRPVTISLEDAKAVEPGLLLFAAFVVRGLAEDAEGAAVVVTTSTVG
jgi:hypothetical protein